MNPLFLEIEDFYEKLSSGEFDEPLVVHQANFAWY